MSKKHFDSHALFLLGLISALFADISNSVARDLTPDAIRLTNGAQLHPSCKKYFYSAGHQHSVLQEINEAQDNASSALERCGNRWPELKHYTDQAVKQLGQTIFLCDKTYSYFGQPLVLSGSTSGDNPLNVLSKETRKNITLRKPYRPITNGEPVVVINLNRLPDFLTTQRKILQIALNMTDANDSRALEESQDFADFSNRRTDFIETVCSLRHINVVAAWVYETSVEEKSPCVKMFTDEIKDKNIRKYIPSKGMSKLEAKLFCKKLYDIQACRLEEKPDKAQCERTDLAPSTNIRLDFVQEINDRIKKTGVMSEPECP